MTAAAAMSKRQMAAGRQQKAEGRRQTAETSKQEAAGGRQGALQIRQVTAYCLVLSAFLLFAVGCARAPKVPGQTMLPKRLRAAAWERIVTIEREQRPACRPRVVKSEVVEASRGLVVERWVVRACETTVDYLVRLVATERGHDVRVSPPETSHAP